MLEVIAFLLDVMNRYVIWVYVLCLVGVILNLRTYAMARQERADTIFTVEREAATLREGRAMTNVGLLLGLVAVVLVLQFYILPSVDTSVLVQATTTPTLVLTTATPRPTLPPTVAVAEAELTRTHAVPMPTATQAPTATPNVTPTVVTPPPPASPCSEPNTCISSPGSNASIQGMVSIRGTAQHPDFQFFKVEYGVGEEPSGWNSIGETVSQPVAGGTLITFDTAALPNGVYWLRLTVVDSTGNFPPPHRVRVTIAN